MLGFVDWLTTRTNNGRVSWELQSNVVTVKLLGPMVAEFAVVLLGEERVWTQFTIRDEDGKEVFRAYPPRIAGESSAHARVAENLFAAVMEKLSK